MPTLLTNDLFKDPPAGYPQDRSGRVFTATQVDQKAIIVARPEATLTEAARWHNTSGTVILNAVLAANGKVTRINVVKGLRDGLNGNAIAAARQIKFRPATRRGLFVATSMKLEYYFNPY
jgi:TonB family protein